MRVYREYQEISSKKSEGFLFKVTLVSFFFQTNTEENLLTIEEAVKNAHRKGCRLVCFPECAITGLPSDDYKTDVEMATQIPGDITNRIGQLSKTFGLYIAIGLLEQTNGQLYNSAVLFDDEGEIVLKYRRINPQWHGRKVPKNLYVEGKRLNTCSTPFGKIAFAICGDMFDDKVVGMIKKAKPDYLIVPMSRSFGKDCRNKKDWDEKEKWVYAQQVAKIGVTVLLINAFEEGEEGSFGGSMIVSQDGKIIAETEIGQPSTLIYELSASYNTG